MITIAFLLGISFSASFALVLEAILDFDKTDDLIFIPIALGTVGLLGSVVLLSYV